MNIYGEYKSAQCLGISREKKKEIKHFVECGYL